MGFWLQCLKATGKELLYRHIARLVPVSWYKSRVSFQPCPLAGSLHCGSLTLTIKLLQMTILSSKVRWRDEDQPKARHSHANTRKTAEAVFWPTWILNPNDLSWRLPASRDKWAPLAGLSTLKIRSYCSLRGLWAVKQWANSDAAANINIDCHRCPRPGDFLSRRCLWTFVRICKYKFPTLCGCVSPQAVRTLNAAEALKCCLPRIALILNVLWPFQANLCFPPAASIAAEPLHNTRHTTQRELSAAHRQSAPPPPLAPSPSNLVRFFGIFIVDHCWSSSLHSWNWACHAGLEVTSDPNDGQRFGVCFAPATENVTSMTEIALKSRQCLTSV